MAHFTQLGLSGGPDKKPETKPQGKPLPKILPEAQHLHANVNKLTSKQKTATIVGSMIATSLLGVFLLESGCSKEPDKTASLAMPSQIAASQSPGSILTAPMATSTRVAIQPPAKKKSRQRKLSASAYTNPTYGVSFRYPSYDNLKEGEEANLELDGLGPLETNFIRPGGTTISEVELPRRLYAGTNFSAAFFNVSVNPKVTSAECEQFVSPESSDPETDPVTVWKTKVGPTEFHAVEGFAGRENKQADIKYYHVFQNGSCYEFALGLETAAEAVPDEVKSSLKPVDRDEVFRKLNWILSTVKIQAIALSEKTIPEVANVAPAPSTETAITQTH